MSGRVRFFLNIILLAIIVSSLVYCWNLWQEFKLDDKAIVTLSLNLEELEIKLDNINPVVEASGNNTTKDWQGIVANNYFNLKEELKKEKVEEVKKEERVVDNSPDTYLPNFLRNNNSKKLNLRLEAISEIGSNSRALIADKETNKTYILSLGQKIDNYKVHEIKKGQVILIDDKQKEFILEFNK
ncbi:hypothetical protein U472_08170 [Orenia metallireducens]|uniref:Uncharacterized protein n=1 Tax=Orenia metallireducens TaxID=1413210 RepID=A0A1C0A6X1_9FIRM|nr:hypothetical protein [Orenia metallireducens]OCL25993.1 hypothetical protein U472_08170 [Orenia metallireducens]